MFGQDKRLRRDLARWREAGWVTTDGETAILTELSSRRGANLATILAMIAAVLLGFAVMSFVAANWNDLTKLSRLILLFSGLIAATLSAAYLFDRGIDGFGNAATVLGAGIFGANIMLISQMYHMDGNAGDAVLLWTAGALISGLLMRSGPALGFSMILACVWASYETGQRWEVFYPFLGAWAVIAAAMTWLQWKPGVHFAGLALGGFIVSMGFILRYGHAHDLTVILGVVLGAAILAGEKFLPAWNAIWHPALGYALAITFAGLMGLQFVDNPHLGPFVVMAAAALALTLGAIWWGLATNNRGALWLGYAGFSIEVLSVYLNKVGSLLGTSLFFLIAGILAAVLAGMAWRLNARRERLEALA